MDVQESEEFFENSYEFIQNSYVLMIGYFLSSFISSIGTIIIIRLISIEDNSFLNIAFVIPAILIEVAELGLDYASTYFIARNFKKNNLKEVRNIIKINLIVKILIGLIFTFLIALMAVFIAQDFYGINDKRMIFLIQIASIGIISTVLYVAMNSFFLGAQKVKVVQYGTILKTSLRSILSIFLILVGFPLIGPMLGFVLSPLIVVIIYLFFLRKHFFHNKIDKESIEWKELIKMFKYGYPLSFYSLIIGIQFQLYILILTLNGYITEVSYLNIAIVSASLIGILTKSISFTLFPIFSKIEWNNNQKDRKKLVNYYQFSLKFGTLLILPAAMFLILFSGQLLPIVFGEKYRQASLFISTYFIIFLFVSFGSLTIPAFFNGQGKTRYVFYIQLIDIFSTLIGSLVLISHFGAIGMVYGILIGTLISVICGNIFIFKNYGPNFFTNFKNIISIFLITLFVGLITYFLYHQVILIILINKNELFSLIGLGLSFIFYIFVYLFLIGILAQINIKELEFFENSFKKFPLINKIISLISTIEKKIIIIKSLKKK